MDDGLAIQDKAHCGVHAWPRICALQAEAAALNDTVTRLRAFNRSVSHDLRGPLGAVSGVTRLAMQAIERRDTHRALDLLSASAEHTDALNQLVTELLALAEADKVRDECVSLDDVLQEAIDQLALGRAMPLPAIHIEPLFEARGSRALLRQVFVNLVGNAIKFTSTREPAIIEVGLAGGAVFVRDNGVGFHSDAATRLFEPFQRLHGGRHPGFGVGLSMVRLIVERHGGRVWAQSAPEAGATFFFTLGSVASAS